MAMVFSLDRPTVNAERLASLDPLEGENKTTGAQI
jgi:hypothetical protein